MKTLVVLFFVFAGAFTVSASDDLPYKTCEMEKDIDLACSTREAMASMLQTFPREDVYTRQKLLDSEVCIELNKRNVKELRKYDAVKMPIYSNDTIRQVPVLWMKVKLYGKDEFFDIFMSDILLKCK